MMRAQVDWMRVGKRVFIRCEPITHVRVGHVNHSTHLIVDRGEVIQIDHRLIGETWVEAFRRFSGAGQKPNQHGAMARLLFYLGDIGVAVMFPGEVAHAAQAKEGRLNQ